MAEKELSAKEIKELSDLLRRTRKDGEKTFSVLSERAKDFSKELKSVERGLDDTVDELKELQMTKGFNVKNFKQATDELDNIQKQVRDIEKDLQESQSVGGPISDDALRANIEQMKELKSAQNAVSQKIKAMGQSSGEAFGEIGKGMGDVKSMFSAFSSKSPTALKKSTEAAAGMASQLKLSAAGWSAQGGAMKAVGMGAKALGGVMGGLSKVMGGPIGMIGMAVKAVWDLGMAADKVVKDANKAFATFRGPDIMTSDVKKQFDDFNKAAYSTSANWKDGIDVNRVRAFSEALYSSGKAITSLNTGFQSYRDVIHVAAKASAGLGVDITQVGSMMGDMMTNMGADLGKVDRTFSEVAFDAKKAGLSTDRFWTTIQNASASLSMYGLITKGVSKSLKGMMEAGLGANEAQSDVQDMYDAVKNGSLETKSALVSLVGTENVKGMFKDAMKDLEANKGEIELKLEKATDNEERDKLSKELNKVQSIIDRGNKASQGDATVMASELSIIAGKAPDLLAKIITRMSETNDISKISGDRLNVINKAVEKAGFSPKLAKDFIDNAKSIKKGIENSVSATVKSAVGSQNVVDAVTELSSATTEDDQVDATNELQKELEKIKGINYSDAKMMAKMAQSSGVARDALKDLFAVADDDKKTAKQRNADGLKSMNALLANGKEQTKIITSTYTAAEKTKADLADSSESTLKDVVDQTLSYEDMTNIAKDEGKYRLAQLGYAQKLNGMVFGIFQHLAGRNALTEDQKTAAGKVGAWTKEEAVAMAIKAAESMKVQKSIVKEKGTLLDIYGTAVGASKKDDTGKSIFDPNKASSIMQESLRKLISSSTTETPEIKQLMSDLGIKESFNDLKKLDKKGFKDAVKSYKVNEKQLKESEKSAKDAFDKNNELLIKGTETVAQLNIVDGSVKQVVKTILDQKSDKETADLITDLYDQGRKDNKSQEDMQKELVDKFGTKERAIDLLKKGGAGYKGIEKIFGPKEAEKAMGVGAYQMQGAYNKATLSSPEIVTSPGIVKLDPGEVILPKSSNFKTIPADKMAGPTKGTSSKNISITVNATERDLAQKIANEIRSILYNEQVTGMR